MVYSLRTLSIHGPERLSTFLSQTLCGRSFQVSFSPSLNASKPLMCITHALVEFPHAFILRLQTHDHNHHSNFYVNLKMNPGECRSPYYHQTLDRQGRATRPMRQFLPRPTNCHPRGLPLCPRDMISTMAHGQGTGISFQCSSPLPGLSISTISEASISHMARPPLKFGSRKNSDYTATIPLDRQHQALQILNQITPGHPSTTKPRSSPMALDRPVPE